MPDLPPAGPTESDFIDHVDTLESISSPHGAYVEEQIDQEAQDREAIDILQGLREIQTSDPVRWTIERVDGDGDAGLLAKWPTVSLKWEKIRDEFGPGTYAIEGRTNRGKYVRRTTITIASDAPRKVKENMAMGGFNLAEFMTTQEARDRQRRQEDDDRRREDQEREAKRQEREDKRRADQQTLILGALPAVATVLAAMFGNRTDPMALAAALRPPPPPDPIAAIAALKSLMPEAPKGPAPMEQALQLFELLADKAGSAAGNTGWIDVVKEGVKVFGPTVGGAIEATITQARANVQAQQHQSQPDQAPAGHLNGSSPSPALPAPQGPADGTSGDTAMLDLLDLAPHVSWLRAQLQKMSSAAARNRDPELYAAMFLEELPAGLTPDRVLQLLSRSDWPQLLARFNPQVMSQQDWWTRAQRCIVGFIQEAANPEPHRSSSGEVDRPQGVPSLYGEAAPAVTGGES